MIVWRAISVKSKKKTAGNFRKMYATFERCTKLTVKSLKDGLSIDLLHVVFESDP